VWSPAFLLRLNEQLQRLLPHAERVEIAGSSHAMQEENPSAVSRQKGRSASRG
jgi:pimeloyl-ACP methyl ester carboxylesterase